IPTTELPDDSDQATFQVPDDPLTVESFKAGDEGTVEISAGQIDNILESNMGDIEATCTPDDEDTVVNTVDIEEESEEQEENVEISIGQNDNTLESNIGDIEATCTPDDEDTVVNTVDIEEESEEPEESTVNVTYVDEDGEEIADSEELTDEVGESYKAEQKDIDGYEFVEVNGDEEGEHGEDDATVEYVYEKEESDEAEESTVEVTHVDEDGEELADSKELTGEEGESYETEEADIDGYTLKEVNGDEEGEYGEDDATVEYVYEKEESEEPELELNGDE